MPINFWYSVISEANNSTEFYKLGCEIHQWIDVVIVVLHITNSTV